MEQRDHKGGCEVRAADDGKRMITGYAAVFNREANLGKFVEQIDPSAFDKTIQEADVRGLGNHDKNWLLGRTKSGTMRLFKDDVGLRYEIDVNPNDPDGQRALAKIERGDWDGSSFSFSTKRDRWDWNSQPPQRRLLEVGLFDVGPVTFPAYPDATVAARALEPLAKVTGHPVDELLTAMETGEIRSLLDDQVEERAVWTAAYINNLPDSSFLFIESGGSKDSEGKTTPRSLRHFPVRDANGKLDLPHLRNALARIPQSNLSGDQKNVAMRKAQGLLKGAGGSPGRDDDPAGEERAGKVLSAANVARLRDIIDQLEQLVGLGDSDDSQQNSVEVDAEARQAAEELEAAFRALTERIDQELKPTPTLSAATAAAILDVKARQYIR